MADLPSADPAGEFKAQLQRFRAECGNPSVRELERLFAKLGRPQGRSAIQQKLTGATTPDWPFVETFVQACVRHGGTGQDPRLQRWRDGHTRMLAALAGTRASPPAGAGRPYRGLEAFTEADAIWFHGRGGAVQDVLAALINPRAAVLLLGPSGSGKSSLVQAGVLPAVGAGAIPGSDRWLRVSVRPGQDLQAELNQAGVPGAAAALPAALAQRLAAEPSGTRLLLVIDQFEELLMPLAEPEPEQARHRLLAQVGTAAGAAGVTLLLVMRDDFFPQLAAQAPELLAGMPQVSLSAGLDGGQLRDIIVEPSVTAGLTWDPGLPEQIVNDLLAGNDTDGTRRVPATVLPLLGLTLYQLWDRRADTRLTRSAYHSVGGVRGALAVWCTAAVERLDPAERSCAEQVLTALVRPAEPERNVPAVRQPVRLDSLRELVAVGATPDPAEGGGWLIDRVLATLVSHRLVSTRTLPGPDGGPVAVAELAHDALIRDWPLLRGWVERDHRFQDWLRRADERRRRWVRRPSSDDLLHGSDLAEGIEWAGRRPLPRPIAGFLAASRHGQQARVRRVRRLNAVLAGLLAIVAVVAGIAVYQWRTAVAAQQVALSRELAARSAAVRSAEPELAALLAVYAYRTSPTAEATDSLYSAATLQRAEGGGVRHVGLAGPVAYSPDGRHLAGGDGRGSLLVVDLDGGPDRTLETGGGFWPAVAYSPDGRRIAAVPGDGSVWEWDLDTGQTRLLVTGTGRIDAVAYGPDGRHLVVVNPNGPIRLCDLDTGLQRTLTDRSSHATTAAYSPDGHHVAVGGWDGSIRLWDLDTGQPRTLAGHTDVVTAVAYSRDGRRLASVGEDGALRLWDVDTGQSRVLAGRAGPLVGIGYGPAAHLLTGITADGTAQVWDEETGQIRALTGHTDTVTAVAYGPDGRHVASAGTDEAVRVWDLDTGQTRTLTGHLDDILGVAYSPDGQHVASAGGDDQTVRVWDLRTGEGRVLTGHTGKVTAVAYGRDDRYLASAGWDGLIKVWDLDTGQSQTLTGHTDAVTAVAYSSDGRHLASGSADRTVRIWDLDTGQSHTLTGHTDAVTTVAYSPDGHHAASGAADGTVRLWNLDTGEARPVPGHTGPVRAVAYDRTGRHLATGGADRTVRIWPDTLATPAEAVARICTALGYDLSNSERLEYLPPAASGLRACPTR